MNDVESTEILCGRSCTRSIFLYGSVTPYVTLVLCLLHHVYVSIMPIIQRINNLTSSVC